VRTLVIPLVCLSLAASGAAHADMSAEQLVQVGKSYLSRGQPKKALDPLEQAAKLKPKLAAAHRLLALAYSRLGRNADATRELERTVALDPKDYRSLLLLGMAKDLGGDHQGALDAYAKATRVNPKRPEAWHERGMTLLMTGHVAEAVKDLQTAVKVASGKGADLLADLGYALDAAGRAPEAVKVLEKAVKQAPDDPEVRFIFGDALAASGHPAEAVKSYEAARARKKDHWRAAWHEGLVLARMGKQKEAVKALRAALAVKPGEPRVETALAASLAATGHLPEAEKLLAGVVKVAPKDVAAQITLAKVYEAQGKRKEALGAWRRAQRLAPHDKEIRGALKRLRRPHKHR